MLDLRIFHQYSDAWNFNDKTISKQKVFGKYEIG